MKKTRTFIAVIIALGITATVLAVGWIGSSSQLSTYSAYAGQLENSYQKSFSELVTNINNVEVNLSKALISKDNIKKKELYQTINQQCLLCATNLSNLPINHESIVETTKFVNQLGGFSYYLSKKLDADEDMSSADNISINELYNWCVYVQGVINNFAEDINNGFNILENTTMGDTNTKFDQMFADTSSTGTEYPTLIYDGPFSDSIKNKEVLGVVGDEIDQQQAQKIVEDAFKDYKVSDLTFTGNLTGKIEGYNFTFNTTHRKYYAQVTKKGGMLISVSSFGKLSNRAISLKDAENEAEQFAKQLGLNDLKSVWSTDLNGIAYINLTPVINGTIVYPDMIKAKVSLDTGSILGWEARSYAYNHTDRKDFQFVVSEQNARKMVSSELNILSVKKCIIPQDYSNEQLCYEYKCTYNNYVYYVYVSAKTGAEVETLRVVSTTSGNLLE